MRSAGFLIALLCIALCGCATHPHLPIVHTYGDLLAQPAIIVETEPQNRGDNKALPQEAKVRLGQSAIAAPINSAVLLYCLTEDYDIYSCGTGNSRFGPFWISVSYEGGPDVYAKEYRTGWLTHGWENTGHTVLLLTRTIMIDKPGIYVIQFKSIEGKVIAQTTVKGLRSEMQPWLPLTMVKKGDWGGYDTRRSDGTFVSISPIEVSFPGKSAALPVFTEKRDFYKGSFSAFLHDPPKDHKPLDPLPKLVEDKVTLKLEKNGDQFSVTSPERMYNSRLDFAYLTRWWVNGKPFIPPNGSPFETAGSILEIEHATLPFILHVDPSVLGAKPGDTVSLQLLRCDSWNFVSNLAATGEGETGVLSNRISWRVPAIAAEHTSSRP